MGWGWMVVFGTTQFKPRDDNDGDDQDQNYDDDDDDEDEDDDDDDDDDLPQKKTEKTGTLGGGLIFISYTQTCSCWAAFV